MTASVGEIRSRLGEAVSGAGPGLEAANRLCVACVELLEVDGAAISMVTDGHSQGTYGASSEMSRRLDEYQFTYGEGPCLDASTGRTSVLVPDLDSPTERRWPMFAGAVLGDGVRAVFALPIMITSVSVGALDLFRADPGPLSGAHLAGGRLAAELAGLPLQHLILEPEDDRGGAEGGWERPAELDRIEVHQATGMLIGHLDVTPIDALARLRAHAVATGRTASEVAWDIVERRLVLERDLPTDTDEGTPGE